jgi:uncharacterized membrane protein YbhN (UPF0104 family)
LNDIAVLNVLLALLPLAAVTLCVGFRWCVIASAVARPIHLVEAWIVSIIGAALDQVLVTMSGDAYRMWWLNKRTPSLTRAVAGVLLDRAAGVLGIALLVLAFLPRFMRLDTARGLIWMPAALAATVLCGFVALLVIDRMPFNFFRNRWFAGLGILSSSARKVFLSPSSAIPAIAAAVMVHVGVSACIASLAWALGVGLGLAAALTVVPTVMLISLLPISIGGWGVREGAMVIALGLVGVESSDALLISVMYGLGTAAIGVSGGVLWLLGLPAEPARAEGR